MKLKFDVVNYSQADPFIFEDGGRYYLYVTAEDGVEAYSSDDVFGVWIFEGTVAAFEGCHTYWAPSVIKYEDKYYIYVSCIKGKNFEFLHVACAESPLGPFVNEKCLFDHFSIDSHVVETEAGLFLWYAKDNLAPEKKGTRIFVDRLIDPYTPEYTPKEVLTPNFDEEKFTPQCIPGRDWYTIEGPFWFSEGDWQYLMYSGGCFQDDTYHIGYAAAKTDEPDLTKVDFVKHTSDGGFAPVIIRNRFEEGTGHHSVIKLNGEYYAVYHGRDLYVDKNAYRGDARTARICRMHVADGDITAERFEDRV